MLFTVGYNYFYDSAGAWKSAFDLTFNSPSSTSCQNIGMGLGALVANTLETFTALSTFIGD